MTKEIALSDLEQRTRNFIGAVTHFPPALFNKKPSETEWSAAQIAEHVLKVGFGACKAISGETIPTNRPPEQKIAVFKQGLEDETTKRTAPERMLPSTDAQEPRIIIEQARKQKDLLVKAIVSLDLTDACVSFKHPVLGTLTRIEWIYFHIYHVQRHLRQIKRLEERSMF